jgi:hypothetical protein
MACYQVELFLYKRVGISFFETFDISFFTKKITFLFALSFISNNASLWRIYLIHNFIYIHTWAQHCLHNTSIINCCKIKILIEFHLFFQFHNIKTIFHSIIRMFHETISISNLKKKRINLYSMWCEKKKTYVTIDKWWHAKANTKRF